MTRSKTAGAHSGKKNEAARGRRVNQRNAKTRQKHDANRVRASLPRHLVRFLRPSTNLQNPIFELELGLSIASARLVVAVRVVQCSSHWF